MSDNVIILGAGSSAGAGIPLLGNFMDAMLLMARTRAHKGVSLTVGQVKILEEAVKVRDVLDGYHGRVAIDTWNLEDVLSVLSFGAEAGGVRERALLKWMRKAIAVVLEVSCHVKHSGALDRIDDTQQNYYVEFWRALIDWSLERNVNPPPILTFNYDLVLERSLLHALTGTYYRNDGRRFDRDYVCLDYCTKNYPPVFFQTQDVDWRIANSSMYRHEHGMALSELKNRPVNPENCFSIKIIKLHGSANFPWLPISASSTAAGLVSALEDPMILPPVFNKMTNSSAKDVWSAAQAAIRICTNLIICGYSMPPSDVYMRYFLKSALGPNRNLDKIFVFDPSVFGDGVPSSGDSLENRYASNFSDPIRKRINFRFHETSKSRGTFRQLASALATRPREILFG